jgi:hypothetical protein
MSESQPASEEKVEPIDLEGALAALRKDYTKLGARIRSIRHSVTCECAGVSLRLHFPSLRQGQATVLELVDMIALYLVHFTLSRTEVSALNAEYGKISADDFEVRFLQLAESARSLFKRAHDATNRNGEAGELLLYLLTEWVLVRRSVRIN